MYRPTFVFLLLLALFAEPSSAQLNLWRWQNPPVQGNTLQSVQMMSSLVTYACGNNATFLRTTDGGMTWDAQEHLFKLDGRNFYSLSFLNLNYGMMCGDSGKVLRTTDGGDSWTILKTNTQTQFNSIVVLDVNTAIVVGKAGTMLRTVDGGNTWIAIGFEIKARFVNIRKLRPDFVTIVGENGLLFKSVDSGKSWIQIKIRIGGNDIVNHLFGQVFIDDNTATVIGTPGEIFHTTDAGISWVRQGLADTANLSVALNQIDGRDRNVLGIVGDYGTILSTTNGGDTWYKRIVHTQDSLHAISFFDKFNATAVGRDGIILRTSDGGISWKFLPSDPLVDPLYSIAFPKGDTSLGIAVGIYGTILRTVNGGTNWFPIQTKFGKTLRSVCFLDAITMVAVGDYGSMLKSTDAGLSWDSLYSGTTKHLYGVSFATPNIGLAAGDSGIALTTSDAGRTWVKHQFKNKDVFTCVAFPDSLTGYMGSGRFFARGLFKTTDGGATWTIPPESVNNKISAISAPSKSTIAIIGGCGAIMGGGVGTVRVSHDEGKTWQDGVFGYFNGIHFIDDSTGTFVGKGGDSILNKFTQEVYYTGIYHTRDGGKTWIKQNDPAIEDLQGVFFGNKKAGTAVGLRGTILRITTDE
ncbi:MAG: YCF48-related protein [Ignavibacteriota bacterium]